MEILGIFGLWHILILLLVTLLPIIALVDILKSEFDGYDKIIFTLIVLFLPVIGPILYFIVGPSRKKDNRQNFS